MTNVFSSTSSIQLQGTVHPDSYFQIVEKNEIDWQLWIDVLQGQVAGAIFRDVLTPELRQQISHNFWHSSTLMQKGKDLPSDYHYEALLGPCIGIIGSQTLEFYFSELERSRQDMEKLFDNTDDFFRSLIGNLREHLNNQGIFVRAAEYKGTKAAEYKMRCCLGSTTTDFVLTPHDDIGFFRSSRLKDFEVSQLVNRRLIAAMFCLENGGGGELHYWNLRVNDETREALGFQKDDDSYGYSLELLANFKKIVLPIRSGDIYLFDSTKVHAVGPLSKEGGQRSTISWFMGFLDSTTAIY